jgi:hypothetical protein
MDGQSQLIAAAIYHAEFARLQCIHCQIRSIYEEGAHLTEVVEAMCYVTARTFTQHGFKSRLVCDKALSFCPGSVGGTKFNENLVSY